MTDVGSIALEQDILRKGEMGETGEESGTQQRQMATRGDEGDGGDRETERGRGRRVKQGGR